MKSTNQEPRTRNQEPSPRTCGNCLHHVIMPGCLRRHRCTKFMEIRIDAQTEACVYWECTRKHGQRIEIKYKAKG